MTLKRLSALLAVTFLLGGVSGWVTRRQTLEQVTTIAGTEKERVVERVVHRASDGSEMVEERVITRNSTSVTTIRPPAPKNRLVLGVGTGLDLVPVYKLGYERRVFEAVWLGAYVTTDKTVGVSLGVEF